MLLTSLSLCTYFLVFISSSGLLPKKISMPFLIRGFIGSLMCSLLLIPILYLNARLVNLIIPLLIIIGYVNLLRHNFLHLLYLESRKITLKKIVFFSLTFILVIVACLDFFPTRYEYEQHDLLYWSWAANFSGIDYSGAIRSSIAWPMNLTSYHLLSGVFLGYINYLSPLQNLSGIVLAKFFVVVVTLSVLMYSALLKKPKKIIQVLLSFLVTFIIFRYEISYNLLISNYLVTLIVFVIFWVMFHLKSNNKSLILAILFYVMSFSKFILLPIGLLLSLVFYFRIKAKPPLKFVLLFFLIGFSNLCTWLFVQKPNDSASIDFYNPLEPNYFVQSLKYIDWIVDPLLSWDDNRGFRFILGGLILALYIGKVFLPFNFASRKLIAIRVFGLDKFEQMSYIVSFQLLMLYAIFGYLFIRVGSLGIKHSAHLLFIASLVTFGLVAIYLSTLRLSRIGFSMFILIVLFLALFSPYKLNNGGSIISPLRDSGPGTVRNSVLGVSEFSQSNLIDTHVQMQLKASILGEKLSCSNAEEDRMTSIVYLFLYEPKGTSC